MNLTVVTLILAGAVLLLLAIAMGWVLGWANRTFFVPVDPRVEALTGVLPGANCGGCGYVGCGEYAEAIASGKEPNLTLCGPGGTGCVAAIGGIMGINVGNAWPARAVVHCAATTEQRLKRVPYHGEQSCASAHLVGGIQGCVYGCLGFGDCVVSCEYDAIHVINGVAVVNDKCVGCKACVKSCPRGLIKMVPFKADAMLVVACSNKDFAKDVKDVCLIGCTGCKACTRATNLLSMDGNLPRLDYDSYQPDTDLSAVPAKCKAERLVFIGRVGAPANDGLADTPKA